MESLFSTDITFQELGLVDSLLKGVEKLGFVHPTKAQADMVPLALAGRDVLGQSKTGTGKTAAFGLPLLQMIDLDSPLSALVLVPTRELAIQVTHEIRELGTFMDVKTIAVYGGQRIQIQVEKLKKKPHLIIGTPGRIMDQPSCYESYSASESFDSVAS